jgi:hypothetical protein
MVIFYSKGYTMNKLAQFAINHGFKTALFSSFVLVWDADGSTAVRNLQELKAWMGY